MTGSVVTCRAGGGWWALEVSAVAEVLRAPLVTRIPDRPRTLSGLVALRGRVLAVVDLAACLGRAGGDTAGGDTAGGDVLVLHRGGPVTGLLVDRVHDVAELSDVPLEAAPDGLDDSARRWVRGTLRLPGRPPLALLDDAVVHASAGA